MLKKAVFFIIFTLALLTPTSAKADIDVNTGNVRVRSGENGVTIITPRTKINSSRDNFSRINNNGRDRYRINSKYGRLKSVELRNNQRTFCRGNNRVVRQESTQINQGDRIIVRNRIDTNCR
ncbi:MAG TPA: hypothetical protein V6C58_00720 [Allocoleopsis sp.]